MMEMEEAIWHLKQMRPDNPRKHESKMRQKAIDIAISTMEAYSNVLLLRSTELKEKLEEQHDICKNASSH